MSKARLIVDETTVHLFSPAGKQNHAVVSGMGASQFLQATVGLGVRCGASVWRND
jgi:hypothetical protein